MYKLFGRVISKPSVECYLFGVVIFNQSALVIFKPILTW